MAAIGAVVSFLISLIVFFALVVIDVIHNACKKTNANTTLRICLVVSQCIGAILYFVGNNSSDITRMHGEELQCGETCSSIWKAVAMICLGSALAYFNLIPPCLHRIFKYYHYEDMQTDWFSSTAMIAIFIKIDALFNTVNLAAERADYQCSYFTVVLTTIFILVCILLGLGLMVSHFIYSLAMLRKRQDERYAGRQVVFITSFVLLFICFPPYLLTDNHLPLDCAFGCASSVDLNNNGTSSDRSCDLTGSSALRLALSLVLLATTILVSLLLILYKRKMAKKEMDLALTYAKFN